MSREDSFIATHSAFGLTAIVLAGAAGMRLGHALMVPGRLTRRQSLVKATHESAMLLYGITAMLLIAAGIEAFWSSARWLPSSVKYGVAGVCWTAVVCYFALPRSRRVDGGRGAHPPRHRAGEPLSRRKTRRAHLRPLCGIVRMKDGGR